MSRPLTLLSAAVLITSQLGCDQPTPLPGDEVIGSFSFTATRIADAGTCRQGAGLEMPDVPLDSSLGFAGTFSRCSGRIATAECEAQAGRAFFTILHPSGPVTRPAGWDGQVAHVDPLEAPRSFAGCVQGDAGNPAIPEQRCSSEMEDEFTAAIFSASQAAAVGAPFACPPDALDGGVPGPNDAGITAPGPTSAGYDAVRACGVFFARIRANEYCTCRQSLDGGAPPLPAEGCEVVFRLEGVRQ